MEPSCPLETTRCILQAKFHQKPYNKSFMDLDFVSVHKHAKKELGQYDLTEQTWSITHTYNFRTGQRVSCNLIGRAVPYMTLYKPFQAVYITFSRPGHLAHQLCHLGMNFSLTWKTSLQVQLTPSGLLMGLSSAIIYTSKLILCSTICVPSATRHNIHMYPYFLFVAIHHLKSSPTFSVRPCSSVGRVTVDLIRRSWVRFPPRSKDFFFAWCGSLFP